MTTTISPVLMPYRGERRSCPVQDGLPEMGSRGFLMGPGSSPAFSKRQPRRLECGLFHLVTEIRRGSQMTRRTMVPLTYPQTDVRSSPANFMTKAHFGCSRTENRWKLDP